MFWNLIPQFKLSPLAHHSPRPTSLDLRAYLSISLSFPDLHLHYVRVAADANA